MDTTPSAWPSQLRLRGQAAAPEGPVDMSAMYVMHHGFRRDLASFSAAATRTPATDREAWGALHERWEVFGRVLRHHHRGEDQGLWPLLLQRADPAEQRVLEAVDAEHSEIDPLLESCREGFARLANHADPDARAALAVRLAAIRERLGAHLAHEEADAILLVQKYLTGAEWRAVELEHFRRDLRPSQVAALVPWAALGLPGEVRDRMLSDAGMPFHAVYLLTRRRFARREAVAFRHVS